MFYYQKQADADLLYTDVDLYSGVLRHDIEENFHTYEYFIELCW